MNTCQWMLPRNKRRSHTNIDSVTISLTNGQEFNHVAVGICGGNVIGAYGGNTLNVNVINGEIRVERQ